MMICSPFEQSFQIWKQLLVDGKQRGAGWSSGVTGQLRWDVSLTYNDTAVEIVPTPELQRATAELGCWVCKRVSWHR
jgi:hypothetical protein